MLFLLCKTNKGMGISEEHGGGDGFGFFLLSSPSLSPDFFNKVTRQIS